MRFDFERASDPAAAALRARILGALPAGGYSMDRFFQLLDVEVSDEVDSAAVRCGDHPKLLVNAAFVERYCRTDEHLFLLVMHELMHVVLGHTRLFPQSTLAHNLAFDAVINAMLCRQFPGSEYVGFFQALNDWETFPGRLLRPAPGWPKRPGSWPADASEAERTLHQRLYGNSARDVTYHEIFEVLSALVNEAVGAAKSDPPRAAGEPGVPAGDESSRAPRPPRWSPAREPTLIGSHDPRTDHPTDSSTLRDALRRTVAAWPASKRKISRQHDTLAQTLALGSRELPQPHLERAIERLFQRAGLSEAQTVAVRRRESGVTPSEFSTVVPQIGDRRARLRSSLCGTPAVFYSGYHAARRMTPRPICRAFVYLDVSGSMIQVLPRLLASLRRPVRDGVARLFVFSTIVDEVDPRSLDTSRVKTTGGTDIDCVLRHVLALPAPKCPKRIVLLTDGEIGKPTPELVRKLASRRIEVITGLTPPYHRTHVAEFRGHVEVLPTLDGSDRTGIGAQPAVKRPCV